MKKLMLAIALATSIATSGCEKDKVDPPVPANLPRTGVPAEMKALWMYGNFSTTEYWSRNPDTYIGNALEMAVAFQFEENGTYTHYFTSSSVSGGIRTYQQSVAKGGIEIDEAQKTIKLHSASAHYKRTRSNQVLEERDLAKEELSGTTTYKYQIGTEANGTKALYLTLNGTSNPLTFLKKQ